MKSKVCLSAIMCLLFFCGNVYGQRKKHSLEVGLGIWNTNEILNTFSDMIVSSLPNDMEMKDDGSYGSVHLGYKYHSSRIFAVGGFVAYDYAQSKGFVAGIETGKFYKTHYTFALETELTYLPLGAFNMYALAGIGRTFYHLKYKSNNGENLNDSATNPYTTFQITPVGLRFGRNAGAFLELGFGYRGILNAGLFARF
ncbi:MAG: hypothetical protein LBC47_04985 [Tannerella sp.]|jgi:hypothetical protein|nr:hypothetical protein [Tannerella sp.]